MLYANPAPVNDLRAGTKAQPVRISLKIIPTAFLISRSRKQRDLPSFFYAGVKPALFVLAARVVDLQSIKRRIICMLIRRIDHVELIVGNALQAAQFYRLVLGFDICAYAGPETGSTATTSYMLQQNDIRIVLTSPRTPDSDISAHLSKHGEGVRDIAFTVDDAAEAFHEAVDRGAAPVQEPI